MESSLHISTEGEDGVHSDIVAQRFWGKESHSTFFDLMDFNHFASTYSKTAEMKRKKKKEI